MSKAWNICFHKTATQHPPKRKQKETQQAKTKLCLLEYIINPVLRRLVTYVRPIQKTLAGGYDMEDDALSTYFIRHQQHDQS